MRLKKVLLQSPEVEWCANTSCQWHPTASSFINGLIVCFKTTTRMLRGHFTRYKYTRGFSRHFPAYYCITRTHFNVFVRCSKIEQNTKNIDLPIFKNPISVICGSGIFFSSKKSQVLMNSQTNN